MKTTTVDNTTSYTNSRAIVGYTPHISWSAVIAGFVIAMTISAGLIIFGMALGLSIMDFKDGISIQAASIGTALWIVVSGSFAIFCGAFVAGRLSQNVTDFSGMVNGVLVWALLSLSTIYILGAGAVNTTQGALSAVSATASTAVEAGSNIGVEGLKALVPNNGMDAFVNALSKDASNLSNSLDELKAPELKRVVQEESQKLQGKLKGIAMEALKDPNNTQGAVEQAKNEVRNSIQTIKGSLTEEKVKTIIAQNSELSKAEVDETYANWKAKMTEIEANWETKMNELQANLEQTKQNVIRGADEVANDVATGLFVFFVLMGLGMSASVVAGIAGVRSSSLQTV